MKRVISFHQFNEMLAGHLGFDINGLTRDTSFVDDLGIDSLSLVNFIIKLEKKFAIKIEMDKVWSLKNVGDAYDAFIQKVNAIKSSGSKKKEHNT